MIQTRITELLGIEYPIFQGGMAWIADGELAAAVSNGGGLGIIAAMNADAAFLRQQIAIARKLTDKPFGVNIMLMSPHVEEVAKTVIEERIPVVTTGAGNPTKYMKDWLAAGIQVIPVVASRAMTKLVARSGAAAVIAEGTESGGHIGELTTMTLVPLICDCTDLPVIAAGGIGDGRGAAAAFALGAEGLQLGTRFLLAEECNVHPNFKKLVLQAKDVDSITTGKRLGHPVRSLKTPFSRAYFQAEYDAAITNEELEEMGAGTLRLAVMEGDEKNGCFPAGQIAAMLTKEQPAAEIIQEIFADMTVVMQKLPVRP